MKPQSQAGFTGPHLELIAISETASRAIPPLFPLSASVAVNPYLGQTGMSLPQTAALMARVSGSRVTMPNAWYRNAIKEGSVTQADLDAALANAPDGAPRTREALMAALEADGPLPEPLPTVADLARELSGIDWPGLIEDRIGAWASGYFDTGQALWKVTPGRDAFESWQVFASRDLTPEIAGLSGFAALVAGLPGRSRTVLALACDALDLRAAAAATYFHQLLLSLGGWSQVARYRLWQAELQGEADATTTDLLTIRLVWEQALFGLYGGRIAARWAEVRKRHETPVTPSAAHLAAAIAQEATERAAQRKLGQVLETAGRDQSDGRPSVQAAFCIDVRSEVFRRAFESLDPGIQTLGFAGFFGLTPAHRDFASDVPEPRLPVLLSPGLKSTATSAADLDADRDSRLAARAARAWGRFKLAAVSSFAFVEATGPIYVAKLLRDALGLPKQGRKTAPRPQFSDDFAMPDRIAAAARILRAMSLTRNFAPLVVMVGHGANVVNNPHESALHCGACGGYKGDVNARLLANMLNAPDLRKGLAAEGIEIPEDTVFLGALHDTTTDAVTLFDTEAAPADKLATLRDWFEQAGRIARTERALRLPRAKAEASVPARSKDWAEVRPEWGLASCYALVAAPRSRTRGKPLGGRVFLHDYDWRDDDGFGVLELILTAPVVVASWISLQYYGSVVAPEVFGAGNKLLHNVTGGIGVVEGNGGNLRSGLPWQSVHDGSGFVHQPLRLTVCVEAPAEAISDVLARHEGVRALFDNRWLHLFTLNDEGRLAQRYAGDLSWEAA